MQIKQMDRRTVQLLSDAITQALQPLAAQYGVKIDRGSASYNDQNFTLKVSVAVIGAGGVAVSKEVTDFKRYAEFKGMKADDLGKTVSISGKSYTYIPNPYYYDQTRIKWDKMVIGTFEDANSGIQALKSGQLKLMISDPPFLAFHSSRALRRASSRAQSFRASFSMMARSQSRS